MGVKAGVKEECGCKRLWVWITSSYEQLDVDMTVKVLQESLSDSGIEVRRMPEEGVTAGTKVVEEDSLILGDCDGVQIGIGEKYRGDAHFVTYYAEDVDAQYLKLVWARTRNKPLVIAETDRLLIREMTMEDLDDLYELYASVRACPYIEPLYERAEEEEFSRKYIENMYTFYGYGLWLVFWKGTGKLVARVGIENRVIDGESVQELGYVVHADYQRRHIAWESCLAALEYAEQVLCLDRIYTCIHGENLPSIALAQKLGFALYAEAVNGMNIYQKKLEPLI